MSTGIYPTSRRSRCEHILKDARVKVLFVENQEQYDKAAGGARQCPVAAAAS